MPRFAANLTLMFNEWPLLDRFDAAAQAGFTAVEVLLPYDHPPDAIAERLHRNHLTLALFNLAPGDFANGERGLAALPDRFPDFQRAVTQAIVYASATGVKRLHLMAGLADRDDPCAAAAYRKAVSWAAERLAHEGIDVLLEPINNRDIPGYFLNNFDFTEKLIRELALPTVRLQFDVYHRQILHGDVTTALARLMPMIGHIQIASVPSRHEPDSEELNFPFLFRELDRFGFVGCEYRPRGSTLDGLGWLKPYRHNAG